jgi:hypothetical protein
MVKSRGAQGSKTDNTREFEQYFSGIFEERWTPLKQALLKPAQLVALENHFTQDDLGTDPSFQTWVEGGSCRTFRQVLCVCGCVISMQSAHHTLFEGVQAARWTLVCLVCSS